MAVRVTKDDVDKIIEIDANITNIDSFITTANLLIKNAGLEDVHDADTLTNIELWLTAHFVAIRDQRVSQEGAGSVSASYQYKVGDGLKTTMYGQNVLMLDTSNKLASLGTADNLEASVNVGINFLGGTVDETD